MRGNNYGLLPWDILFRSKTNLNFQHLVVKEFKQFQDACSQSGILYRSQDLIKFLKNPTILSWCLNRCHWKKWNQCVIVTISCSMFKAYIIPIWIEKLRSPIVAKTWNELIVVIKQENTSGTSLCIFVRFRSK